jgi:hypothetical protein
MGSHSIPTTGRNQKKLPSMNSTPSASRFRRESGVRSQRIALVARSGAWLIECLIEQLLSAVICPEAVESLHDQPDPVPVALPLPGTQLVSRRVGAATPGET